MNVKAHADLFGCLATASMLLPLAIGSYKLSNKTVESMRIRASTDRAFAFLLWNDPDAVVRMYGLTGQDVVELKSIFQVGYDRWMGAFREVPGRQSQARQQYPTCRARLDRAERSVQMHRDSMIQSHST